MEPKISISIDVSDMEKATLFYSEALGCKKVRTGDDITVLAAENATIYLLKKESGTNPLLSGAITRNYKTLDAHTS